MVFLIKPQKNGEKRKKYNAMSGVDTFIVLRIQDLKQLASLSPRFIDISNSPSFLGFLSRYLPSNFVYGFKLMSVTLSISIVNLDNNVLVICVGLNECKKADMNGVQENILAIIHTENVANWEQLRNTSSWINIDLVDYLEVQEASNISFSFITESVHDISKFDIYLKNSKREHIKFKENKEKIPQFNFVIS